MSIPWEAITDLSDVDQAAASSELSALRSVWIEQKQGMDGDGTLAEFTEKLCRNWAIETGILERLYTLDRGVTTLLIEQGLDASVIPHGATDLAPEELVTILEDHREAVESVYDWIREGRELTVFYVKTLHEILTRHQPTTRGKDSLGQFVDIPLRRGAFKLHSNNPTRFDGLVHEYCPPEHVDAEMERLVSLHLEQVERGVPPEVQCAWLHHRFTQIHPFQDGNGRVARSLASLVMLRAQLFPVVIDRDHRVEYIDALESADTGSLAELVDFVVAREKQSLVDALGLVREVSGAKSVADVIQSARDTMSARLQQEREEMESVKSLAASLLERAASRMEKVAADVTSALEGAGHSAATVDVGRAGQDSDFWFRNQIIAAARSLDYFADLAESRSWTRLAIHGEPQHNILVAIHGLGRPFRGVMAASGAYFRRTTNEDDERETGEVSVLGKQVFQFNYRDDPVDAERRFDAWLEEVLMRGLEFWRTSL